jgi:hypothetical protein
MITLSLVPTVALVGLVVDLGWGYYRKQMAKTAAVSAANAAVLAVSGLSSYTTCNLNGLTCQNETACPSSPTTPPSSNMINGCLYAKQNGFVNSGNQTVTMQAHGPDGVAPPDASTSPTYWVTATVSETEPLTFLSVLGSSTTKVVSRSTSGLYIKAGGACIYVLDPVGSSALNAGGTPDVEATCGIYVNSNSPSAMRVGGTSAVVDSSVISIVGNYTTNGHPTINPTPKVGQSAVADPFANVPAPSVPSRCDSNTGIPNSGITMPSDGFYVVCAGGFSMTGGPSVTLPAGTYVLKAGDIDLRNGTLTGTGVTFYLTGTFSGITINGNVTLNLSAPTSGPDRGLLFYQDRSLAVGAFSSIINGTSDSFMNGSLYFPTTSVTYTGGSNTQVSYTAIVAYDVSFQGTSYFYADASGKYTGINTPTVGIIE